MSVQIISNRLFASVVVSVVGLLAGAACGQSSSGYEGRGHVVPVGYGYGGYGYHSSTVAEGYLRGKAAVIDSIGNFEVNDAQAGILNEQGRSLNRENDLKQTEALLAQKQMWEDARLEARRDREIRGAEGKQLLAARRSTTYTDAYRLADGELNYRTGQIMWPEALAGGQFEQDRARMEELYRQLTAYGTPRSAVARQIAHTVDKWSRALRSDVASMSREDYLEAQKFLLGLKYSATSMVVAAS